MGGGRVTDLRQKLFRQITKLFTSVDKVFQFLFYESEKENFVLWHNGKLGCFVGKLQTLCLPGIAMTNCAFQTMLVN